MLNINTGKDNTAYVTWKRQGEREGEGGRGEGQKLNRFIY